MISGPVSRTVASSVFLVCALVFCAACVSARERLPATDEIQLSDVMSYGMWFRNSDGMDQTIEYADAVLAGRFKPRRDVEYWEFDSSVDWSADPYKDDNWQFLLHSLYMLDPLLVAEDMYSDKKYARAALEIVADWEEYHQTREAKYSWYNMAVGMRSAKLAYLHDLVARKYSDLLSPELEQMFQRMSQQHVAKVVDGTIALRMTNHGLFQIHGVVALCREFSELLACNPADEFVRTNLARIIDAQFDNEGVHLEHSPGYHRFVIDKLQALRNTGWYSDFPEIESIVEKAVDNMFWMLDPSNRLWAIGDTIPSVYPSAKALPLPSERCPEDASSGLQVASDNCVLIRHFASGYVSIRSPASVPVENASGLFYQGGFHSNVHKHLDDQTFELFENGNRIVVDSGYFNYQRHPMRRYMQSTRAHNTVEIGSKDFSRKDEHAYGSAVQEARRVADYFVIRGRVEHKALSAIHSRQLLYKPGNWLLVRDWVTGGSRRQVVQWFHLNPEAVIQQQSDVEVVVGLSGSVYRFRSLTGCKPLVEKGAKEPRLQGWYSPTQGEAIANYAIGFQCLESDSPMQVAIFTSEDGASDFETRFDELQRRHPFR